MFEHAKELRELLRGSNEPQLIGLAELLEMQEELDTAILREHEIRRYPTYKMENALFVEIAEMLNELPSIFKYWKKTAKNDREKALLEYVDALHFALSLTNNNPHYILKDKAFLHKYLAYRKREMPMKIAEEVQRVIYYMVNTQEYLYYLFYLGGILEFTWDEIYKAYKDKNAVNYERLKTGY